MIKRLFDVFFSGLGLILLLPFFMILAFLIAVELVLLGEQPAHSAITTEAKSESLVLFIIIVLLL